MHTMDIDVLARELLNALDRGTSVRSIAERHPGFGWEDAYRVGGALCELRRARGERPIGRKIGFTNRNIWAEYGATAPIWGTVYDRTIVFAADGRASVSLHGAVRPRLEPEIAFKLAHPLPPGCSDPAHILEHVEWVAASFEIVDCHFADWKFQAADAVADFSLHWRLVVGPPLAVSSDDRSALARSLHDCQLVLRQNESIVARGIGANALGHPAMALAHLADVLAGQPQARRLEAGEIITTGTLTPAMPILPGETWRSAYDGILLKGLTVAFTGD
jgi:2-oxo-3-hexenedioate decarboxylase